MTSNTDNSEAILQAKRMLAIEERMRVWALFASRAPVENGKFDDMAHGAAIYADKLMREYDIRVEEAHREPQPEVAHGPSRHPDSFQPKGEA